ncbi:hypothetical protein ACLKA7_005676 [Drosophila subpalustris]
MRANSGYLKREDDTWTTSSEESLNALLTKHFCGCSAHRTGNQPSPEEVPLCPSLHTGTPEIGTTITTDIGTIYTSAATTVQAVRRVVGIAWPQDVAQEARRMNVRAADTRNPYNNKDQVPSPGSSKVIPNCPRSNQDQVLSPGSDKDIRNSLGSNQDRQSLDYQGSIHRPRNSQGPATRLVETRIYHPSLS